MGIERRLMVLMFVVLLASFVACGSGGTSSEEAATVTTAENGSVTLDGDKVTEVLGTEENVSGTDTGTDTVSGTTVPAGSEVAEGGVFPGDQATVESDDIDQQDVSDTAAKEDLQDNLFLYTDRDGDGELDDEDIVVDATIVYNEITDTYTVTPVNGFDSDEAYLVVGVDPETGEKTVLVIINVSAGKDTTAPVLLTANINNGATGVEVGLPLVLEFDEPVSGQSVQAGSVVFEGPADEAVWFRVSCEDGMLTVIPQKKLQPNATYIIIINGITDASGNMAAPVTITWTNRDVDYGLYWFGRYGRCEKYFPGIKNAFFDPAKKTMIYAHGWQFDSVKKQDLYGRAHYFCEMFYWVENNFDGINLNLLQGQPSKFNGFARYINHGWLNKGWNTGIVYWTQFADEPSLVHDITSGNFAGVHDAEAKVWSFSGPKGSRYRTLDANGNPVYRNLGTKVLFDGKERTVNSVGDLLELSVAHALASVTSGDIRITGHSLGSQVATTLAKRCTDKGIRVTRLTLLDPAWSAGSKDYLPRDAYNPRKRSTGERSCKYVEAMRAADRNMAVEIYYSTALNVGGPVGLLMDDNDDLKRIACATNFLPWYYNYVSIDMLPCEKKHNAIRFSYFLSMESDAPTECTVNLLGIRKSTGNVAPSASTSNTRILEMMSSGKQWTQVEGRYTPQTDDDWYKVTDKSYGMITLLP